MNSLDENVDFIDQNDVPFLSTAVKYGLIGGGLATVWTLLSSVMGISQASSTGAIIGTVIGIGIYVGIVYAAIKQHRDEALGGYITMGRAFILGLVACIITGIISGIVGYIYYNHIDPAAMDEAVEASIAMMESFGLPEEQMEEAAKGARDNFGFVGMLLNGTIASAIFGAIISGIMGAIMKKEAPMV